MPYENGVATLRLWLKEPDGEIVMRNFLVFDVQAPGAGPIGSAGSV